MAELPLSESSSGDQLPIEFVQRLKRIVPSEKLASVLASFSATKPTTFRINTLRGSIEDIVGRLELLQIDMKPVPWFCDTSGQPLAYQVAHEHREQLTHNPVVDAGLIYVQNLSSMLAPRMLGAFPGETILDLAAAPGGKTTQLAQMMENTGVLSAVEPVKKRMFKLRANLERCGVSNTRIYQTDGRTVGHKTPNRFDRVLLDAPCSSEARFRAGDPKSWATWSQRKIRETSRKQIGLLKSAIHATRSGGRILYCTCSLSPEENEQVIHKTLKKFGDQVSLIPVELPIENLQDGIVEFDEKSFDPQVKLCRRVLPTEVMDAFFIACFVKA